MIDLESIARAEADGDLFGLLSGLFEPTDVRPKGYPDAVIWKGGNHDGVVKPIVHSLTDAFALLGPWPRSTCWGFPIPRCRCGRNTGTTPSWRRWPGSAISLHLD